jgi:hypothetical protein
MAYASEAVAQNWPRDCPAAPFSVYRDEWIHLK